MNRSGALMALVEYDGPHRCERAYFAEGGWKYWRSWEVPPYTHYDLMVERAAAIEADRRRFAEDVERRVRARGEEEVEEAAKAIARIAAPMYTQPSASARADWRLTEWDDLGPSDKGRYRDYARVALASAATCRVAPQL